MDLKVFVVLCVLGVTFADTANKWDGLKVTWGANPLQFGKEYFDSLPRTRQDALNLGWLEVAKCDNSTDAKVRGNLFSYKGDYSVVLLFDVNGFIAGMQTGVNGNKEHNYPAKALVPPFVQYGQNYYMTVYFTNPATICTEGRSQADFDKNGTGTDLYIQIGPHPESDLMKIPREEKELAGTEWVEGKCFYTMGKHYWFNITDDMSCDRMFPVFLLYNNQQLNAFGWVETLFQYGDRYEHPGTFTYKLFMKSVPKCLATRGKISTMHVYLTDNPVTGNLC